MSKDNNMGTYTITNTTVTISRTDGVKVIALKLLSGAATVQGSAKIGQLGASTAISLVAGEATILSNQSDFIDGLVIAASAGSVAVFTNQ